MCERARVENGDFAWSNSLPFECLSWVFSLFKTFSSIMTRQDQIPFLSKVFLLLSRTLEDGFTLLIRIENNYHAERTKIRLAPEQNNLLIKKAREEFGVQVLTLEQFAELDNVADEMEKRDENVSRSLLVCSVFRKKLLFDLHVSLSLSSCYIFVSGSNIVVFRSSTMAVNRV